MADQAAQAEVPGNNNDVFLLPDELFGPPDYAPVSFENLDQDTDYLVRWTKHGGGFMDFAVHTTHAVNWKTDDTVRPLIMATRKFKHIFSVEVLIEEGLVLADGEEMEEDEDGEMPLLAADLEEHEGKVLTYDEFITIVNDHVRSSEVFDKLEYAKDPNDQLIPEEWYIYEHQLIYPVGREFIKMEISDAEYGYVFFKKVEEEEPAAPPAEGAGIGGRRKTRRRRNTRRRRRNTRRQRRQRR
jgi:hypothetical protein